MNRILSSYDDYFKQHNTHINNSEKMTSTESTTLDKVIELCRERNIIIPTFAELSHPDSLPPKIIDELKSVSIQDIHPRNLFRITWKNDLKTGGFGSVNHLVIPKEISGVNAKIVVLWAKDFPTGAHKVFICLLVFVTFKEYVCIL